MYVDVRYWYGDDQVPRDIVNQRQYTMEAMRRMGTPVLLKRMYTTEDVNLGNAQRSPAWDSIYNQVRHDDPLSHGVGFCSIDTQPGEWYDPVTFEITTTDISGQAPVTPVDPEDFYEASTKMLPAPKYRGYGPGFLTYVILPDRPEDVFKLDPRGAMIRIQNAKLQLPWWPLVGDNDIMIAVQLDDAGNIIESFERYQLKQTTPITMRGDDRFGRREVSGANVGGNRYWVGQECEAVKVMPLTDPIYDVEVDR